MKVDIEVTASDIAAGRRGSAGSCPIALALARALGASGVNVLIWVIAFDARGRRYYADVPEAASRFIDRFDDNGPSAVEPFRFPLEVY